MRSHEKPASLATTAPLEPISFKPAELFVAIYYQLRVLVEIVPSQPGHEMLSVAKRYAHGVSSKTIPMILERLQQGCFASTVAPQDLPEPTSPTQFLHQLSEKVTVGESVVQRAGPHPMG
jgi:hypothetical protein